MATNRVYRKNFKSTLHEFCFTITFNNEDSFPIAKVEKCDIEGYDDEPESEIYLYGLDEMKFVRDTLSECIKPTEEKDKMSENNYITRQELLSILEHLEIKRSFGIIYKIENAFASIIHALRRGKDIKKYSLLSNIVTNIIQENLTLKGENKKLKDRIESIKSL